MVACLPVGKSAGHWGETSSTGLARFGDWREYARAKQAWQPLSCLSTTEQTCCRSSGAGSVENRAHPDTSNKLCRTAYGYALFAKCMLANQKSPYFQDGGPKFKMAAKIYHNTSKPGTISTQQCFVLVKFG